MFEQRYETCFTPRISHGFYYNQDKVWYWNGEFWDDDLCRICNASDEYKGIKFCLLDVKLRINWTCAQRA